MCKITLLPALVERVTLQKAVSSEVSEGEVIKDMHERIVRSFLDVVVLMEVRSKPLSGYDVIDLVHKKFNMLLSSGTVYSLVYSLERDGLIKAVWNQRRREYMLTEKGKETTRIILNARNRIKALTSTVFGKLPILFPDPFGRGLGSVVQNVLQLAAKLLSIVFAVFFLATLIGTFSIIQYYEGTQTIEKA